MRVRFHVVASSNFTSPEMGGTLLYDIVNSEANVCISGIAAQGSHV